MFYTLFVQTGFNLVFRCGQKASCRIKYTLEICCEIFKDLYHEILEGKACQAEGSHPSSLVKASKLCFFNISYNNCIFFRDTLCHHGGLQAKFTDRLVWDGVWIVRSQSNLESDFLTLRAVSLTEEF